MTTRALFKVCLVLIFVEKTYLKHKKSIPKFTILYQFHDQKTLFKVPKICNIIFGLKMIWHFSENSSDLVAGPFPESKWLFLWWTWLFWSWKWWFSRGDDDNGGGAVQWLLYGRSVLSLLPRTLLPNFLSTQIEKKLGKCRKIIQDWRKLMREA